MYRPSKDRLDALKAGDSVTYVSYAGLSRIPCVETITVERRTATQIVCKDQDGREVRYRADNGKKIGGGHFDYLPEQATPEAIAEARAKRRQFSGAQKLAAHDWRKEPLDVIDAALKLIEKKEQQA